MKNKIKKTLEDLAIQMPIRRTSITGFGQTKPDTDKKFNRSGQLTSATLSTFVYKDGAKAVDNFQTLKKAYAKGGMPEVMKTVEHYKGLA